MYKRTLKLKNKWFEEEGRENDALHLLVIGGTHGNESNAVKMVCEFVNRINENSTEGWWKNTYFNRVTVVNALNEVGLKYNEREFNQEEKEETNDLNRFYNDSTVYPSKGDVMGELENVIKDVDVVVDVHNTPNILTCISIALNKNAPTYIDWAIRNKINFVLADDVPTIKRHADVDLGKIAFTYEFSGMGYDQRRDPNWVEWEVNDFEKFLAAIGRLWTFDKIFERQYVYDRDKPNTALKHTFYKKQNNYNTTYLPYLYEKKYFPIPTYGDGVYHWLRGNPLGHYTRGEQIAFIEDPINKSLTGEVRAPCDGTLIDVDDSWWACKGGTLGDFQPDLEQNVYDYYEEEKQNEKQREEMRYAEEPKA